MANNSSPFCLLLAAVSLVALTTSVLATGSHSKSIEIGSECPSHKPTYMKYPVECYRTYIHNRKQTVNSNSLYGSRNYDRIFNGETAGDRMFPSFVKLYINGQLCGGSILNENIILTAAHCFKRNGIESGKIRVYLGAGYQNYEVGGRKKYCLHNNFLNDNWRMGEIEHDMAIIVLEDRLDLGTNANPGSMAGAACLPTTRNFYPFNRAVGLGYLDNSNHLPSKPQSLSVVRTDEDKCYWSDDNGIPMKLLPKMGCYLGEKNNPGTICGGDSGGPIYDSVGDLIGMTTHSASCAASGSKTPFIAIDICENKREILRLADGCYKYSMDKFARESRKTSITEQEIDDNDE